MRRYCIPFASPVTIRALKLTNYVPLGFYFIFSILEATTKILIVLSSTSPHIGIGRKYEYHVWSTTATT